MSDRPPIGSSAIRCIDGVDYIKLSLHDERMFALEEHQDQLMENIDFAITLLRQTLNRLEPIGTEAQGRFSLMKKGMEP